MSVNYTNLFPVRKENKAGFINEKGIVVIDLEFDDALSFSEGLASVRIGEKWGCIDTSGNMIISPKFDSGFDFSEGLAGMIVGAKYGYIYPDGTYAIPPRYFGLPGDFHDGIARVQPTKELIYEFIDKSGNTILSGRKFLVSHYSEGLINCPSKGKWGYLNLDDTFVIAPQYLHARPFYGGLAAVSNEETGDEPLYHFIDKENNIIIQQNFMGADIRFSEGLCVVWNELFGYIHMTGKLVMPYCFEYAGHFSEGLAVVKLPDDSLYGFIDKTGKIVIPPTFANAKPFRHGLAEIIIGESYKTYRYGYINHAGEYVWSPSR